MEKFTWGLKYSLFSCSQMSVLKYDNICGLKTLDISLYFSRIKSPKLGFKYLIKWYITSCFYKWEESHFPFSVPFSKPWRKIIRGLFSQILYLPKSQLPIFSWVWWGFNMEIWENQFLHESQCIQRVHHR